MGGVPMTPGPARPVSICAVRPDMPCICNTNLCGSP